MIKYVPEFNYLISSNYNSKCASFDVFSIDKYRSIFNFGRNQGGRASLWLGYLFSCLLVINEIAFNVKREILAALSIENNTLYHLFDLNDFQFAKKASWPEQHAGMGNMSQSNV